MNTTLIWPQCPVCGVNLQYEPNASGTAPYYICHKDRKVLNVGAMEFVNLPPNPAPTKEGKTE